MTQHELEMFNQKVINIAMCVISGLIGSLFSLLLYLICKAV